ncbi:MAG: hypothetical protein WBA16_04890 [Nonlabens sp.]
MVSNEKINKLGKRIRENDVPLSNYDLETLQDFRLSYYEPMRTTFNHLVAIKSKVRTSAIVAFRLKRISTIINKLSRERGMKLSRMGDIAGLRVIVDNDKEVFKLRDIIANQFQTSGSIRDYISSPKPIGYRGVHIYIIDNNSGKRIEIQLRTVKHHNWSTLVEITDFIYGTRLKEIGYESDPEFAKFHSLMSSDKELETDEAELVYKILEQRDFINRLSELFRRNSEEVRAQWNPKMSKNKFFLIEASKNSVPIIKGFRDYNKAEAQYFKQYSNSKNTEIVLAAISKPSFSQLSLAYSNYILSYHTFISDAEDIVKNLVIRSLELGQVKKFKAIFKTYEIIQSNILLGIVFEEFSLIFSEEKGDLILYPGNKLTMREFNRIRNRLKIQLTKRGNKHNSFIEELAYYVPRSILKKWRCEYFLKSHSKRIATILEKQARSFKTNSTIKK